MAFAKYDHAGSRKRLDWEATQQRAREMTLRELVGAIQDCRETIQNGLPRDEGFYRDELSVYKKELNSRSEGVIHVV